MFKNYLKIAFRALWKNKGYSAINILGLATGLATCLLIMLYVWDELGYDAYNEKAARIYRVDGDIQFGGTHFILAVAPDPLGPALKKDYPQVEQYARFRGHGGFLVKKDNENLREDRVIFADSTVFDVFSLPMISGDPRTALVDPQSIVINEKTARKYFNSTDVVGRHFMINDTGNYKITGVIKDIPQQSHFNFDFFVSMSSNPESRQNSWVSNNFNTYIVLKKGSKAPALEAQLPGMIDKYMGPQVKQLMNISMDEFLKNGNWDKVSLTALRDIHLHSDKTAELGANSSIQYVYIFSSIAIFILLIACVNFMNLATARSAGRAKEVGVRKVLGSLRGELIKQFLTESVLISFIALLLALAMASLLLPNFNQLAGKEMHIGLFTKPLLLPSLLALVLLVGLLAGSYPAFFLSAFQPIEVLKGKLSGGFKNSWLRSSLVVFQFWISIILLISTAVIYRQLGYIRNKDLGFNREQVLVLQNTHALGAQAKTFKQELQKMQGVKSVTMTGFLPTGRWRTDSPLFPDAVPDPKRALSAQIWEVDENYIPTLGMQVLQGRNFSDQLLTDSSGIILNEAALHLLGIKDPLNKPLYYMNSFTDKKDLSAYHIIGIIKNFNFNSLREEVSPLVLLLRNQPGGIAIRMDSKNAGGLVKQVESKWKAMVPGQPFAFSFMDDDFNNLYNTEQRMGKIFISFAALAIFIACLGLLGLVTYAAEQRTREIGIRKVLGATTGNIVGMLSRDFCKLVIIAALVAFPVAGWMMSKWLQAFAYRTSMGWWIFAMAGLIAIVIALVTVSLQAMKAALANPVKSLRSE